MYSIFYKIGLISFILYGCSHASILPKAKEFIPTQWIQSDPLSVKSLYGKVILIRWWTDSCEYCVHTASALNEWYDLFPKDKFIIIGMYHPKPFGRAVSIHDVENYIAEKNFKFPIAIDNEWRNLFEYWIADHGLTDFTSVSFLIDKKSRIKYIHPGGEYHPSDDIEHRECNETYWHIKSLIEELISE